MSLVELSNGSSLNFPRRLFEAFIEFAHAYSTQTGFAVEMERIYTVNWQVIAINEIPHSLHGEFITMLAEFSVAISNGEVITDVRTAEMLVCTVLKDLKRHGHA